MSKSIERRIRRRLPDVHRKLESGLWETAGITGSGHFWLRHIPSGRRVTAPCSASDHRAHRNLVKLMDRFERGEHER